MRAAIVVIAKARSRRSRGVTSITPNAIFDFQRSSKRPASIVFQSRARAAPTRAARVIDDADGVRASIGVGPIARIALEAT
jgi:hypothetical protein